LVVGIRSIAYFAHMIHDINACRHLAAQRKTKSLAVSTALYVSRAVMREIEAWKDKAVHTTSRLKSGALHTKTLLSFIMRG
jgi:hypothetical protein